MKRANFPHRKAKRHAEAIIRQSNVELENTKKYRKEKLNEDSNH